jgi:hypothetical protein
MATFGFWNVDSLRNLETDEREFPKLAADLALERSLDVLFLIECGISCDSLMAAFTMGPEYYPISCGERFKVFARFDPKLMQRLALPVPSDRFDIWRLMLPLQEEVLISAVHGLDKRNNSPAKQELVLQQLVAGLSYFENTVGHDRSIVLGDFNANPFEAPVAGALGMNAVISRAIAESNPRLMLNHSYPYFYNPMWNLYGDEPRSSAPATYYYRGSDPHELYWHMLDQVLIRPSLLNRFDFSVLDIVTAIRGTELTGATGTPDRTRFSDHLPVVFGVDLSAKNDKGAKHAYEPLARL